MVHGTTTPINQVKDLDIYYFNHVLHTDTNQNGMIHIAAMENKRIADVVV